MSRSSSPTGGGRRAAAPPSGGADDAARPHDPTRTLYRADLSDPRQRAAQPREVMRGRAARRAEATSDVTRFRGVLPATLAGAVATGAAALLFPPPGGHAAPGPLSLPHARAQLACASCHAEQAPSAPQEAAAAREAAASRGAAAGARVDQACVGCHGAHGSTRRSHRQLLASGALSCATCHPIHRGDQGVVFDPARPPVRFAPGAEVELPRSAFRPGQPATVAIVTAGSCAPCHDLAAPRDPIARCLVAAQAPLGDARPITCFDEHRPALPEDAATGRAGGDTRPAGRNAGRAGGDTSPAGRNAGRAGGGTSPAGVCSGQHTEDRALAWDAARDAATALPLVKAGATPGAPALLWMGAGLAAAALAFAGARGGHALRARRARRSARDAGGEDAMLRPAARVRLPRIDTTTCLGCYACVDACPYDVLAVEKYVAVVARPEACCGLTLCEQRCPNGSLTIEGGAPIADRPRLGDDLGSLDVPGLHLAGDVTGLPLIKNAIHQGAHAATRIAEDLRQAGPRGASGQELDLIIVGAGPAGISAALRAKELGLSFEVIEQGSVAQSIQSFPRGKLVFDQPLDLPMTGKLWLKESTKEELLSHWLRIVRKERLPILQDTRMVSVARAAGAGAPAVDATAGRGAPAEAKATAGFVVVTEPREGGPRTERHARRVLLAIGQRGSPRRLPFELSAEVEGRVYYHLADARSLAGSRVLIVGLGDVAMEAAIALSRQPATDVTVVYRGAGFRRGKTRNIEELRRLAAASRLSLLFETDVSALALDPGGALVATLASPSGARAHPCDAVLVLIGSIPPWSALRAAGVRPTAEPSDRSALGDVQGTTPAVPAP
ncbi:NAD(P)-binding domain-containing protein [Sorangium atrum]|uniref:NAD(P)-binding domain-containing protein n=1 Tax=Sorangium atrum TaxID=2995308 RepID=A0ABT5BQJ4_9BACT|nr:NAD(P)-binding domain-containing protein [Sorangium aterium]MDC0676436.1 NAD(P)-binding domain-containing protein [Sorangium aterium]